MNKVFKKVFNAARGMMMVVNETTSSVQTGKKAAVTVAVVGALASGVAQAAGSMIINDSVYTGGRFIGEGKLVIADQTISGTSSALYAGKNGSGVESSVATITKSTFETPGAGYNWTIYGGSRSDSNSIQDGTTEVNVFDTNGALTIYGAGCLNAAGTYTSKLAKVVVENAQLSGKSLSSASVYRGQVFGAGYLSASGTSMTFEKTEVSVNNVWGSATIGSEIQDPGTKVYGGGYLFVTSGSNAKLIVKDSTVIVDGEKTNLSGVYGGSLMSGQNNPGVLEAHKTKIVFKNGHANMVVGGNHLNFYGANASIGSSEIVIEGGSVDLVVGGNYIEIGQEISATRTALADETSVKVLGGTVGTVVGGGYALNANADQTGFDVDLNSSVKSSRILIENAKVTGDVIGGGLSEGDGAAGVTSENVEVVIENTTVEGIITTDDKNDSGIQDSNATGDVSMHLTNVEAEKVQASQGSVTIAAEGKEQKASIGQLVVADNVEVALSADGQANDAAEGDIFAAVGVDASNLENVDAVSVEMAEGMQQGAVGGTIADGQATIRQATNSIMSNTLDLASAAPLAVNRLLMNDVRKRLGNIRSAEGTHGVWARYDGGKLSGAMGLENDFHTLQFGIDTVPVADAPRFGVAFSYTTSDTDMKRGGAEMDAFGLAAYATKMYDNGAFVDVIARIATADTDIVVDGAKKGSMDNLAVSLSGEFGWRFDMTERHYVEPQVEVTYTRVDNSDLTLSEGTSYGFDAVDSVIGRAGFVAGFTCPNNMGDVYVRASAVHEFLGDTAVRSGKVVHALDGDDTWFEYGIGANFNINKNTYVYADVERTAGAALDEDWRANVGVRYSF